MYKNKAKWSKSRNITLIGSLKSNRFPFRRREKARLGITEAHSSWLRDHLQINCPFLYHEARTAQLVIVGKRTNWIPRAMLPQTQCYASAFSMHARSHAIGDCPARLPSLGSSVILDIYTNKSGCEVNVSRIASSIF